MPSARLAVGYPSPRRPRERLVGLVEVEISVVGERALQHDLMAGPERGYELLEKGGVVVERRPRISPWRESRS